MGLSTKGQASSKTECPVLRLLREDMHELFQETNQESIDLQLSEERVISYKFKQPVEAIRK
jgi:hypothetical protein